MKFKPMDKASEAILTLKPVAFRYKQEIDPIADVHCDNGKPFVVHAEEKLAALVELESAIRAVRTTF
jgi:hypothetical protein